MITHEEIQELGWQQFGPILIDDPEDETKDKFVDGYQIDEVPGHKWWVLYSEGKNMVISKRYYENEVAQVWDTVMECPIKDAQDLREQMDFLSILKHVK